VTKKELQQFVEKNLRKNAKPMIDTETRLAATEVEDYEADRL